MVGRDGSDRHAQADRRHGSMAGSRQIVRTEETKKFLNAYGADPLINTPERARRCSERAIKEWGEYVRMAKIEPQ